MNDLSEWKILELHRRENGKTTWYFGIQKPDGKRLYANTSRGATRVMYTAKVPSPVKISTADEVSYGGTSMLQVEALSEAGAIRKIMRYVDALATDWNLRKAIKEAGFKQVNFDKRKPAIIPADHQLEAAKTEPEPEPRRERNDTESYAEYMRRMRDELRGRH